MIRLAANLSMLFNEHAFMDRFAAAAKAGFKGVEYLFPYAYGADELRDALNKNQLEQVLFNLPPGDWDAGERGLASLPGREGEFHDSVVEGLRYAEALNCPQVHAMAGLLRKMPMPRPRLNTTPPISAICILLRKRRLKLAERY